MPVKARSSIGGISLYIEDDTTNRFGKPVEYARISIPDANLAQITQECLHRLGHQSLMTPELMELIRDIQTHG